MIGGLYRTVVVCVLLLCFLPGRDTQADSKLVRSGVQAGRHELLQEQGSRWSRIALRLPVPGAAPQYLFATRRF